MPTDLIGDFLARFALPPEARAAVLALLHADPTTFGEAGTLAPPESDTWIPRGDPSAPLDPPPLALGSRYELMARIGVGGMGEVYRVRDLALGRAVALKVLRPDMARRGDLAGRFLGEAQATAQLQHPGVVPVHEMGRLPDGRWYFTMKEIRGRSLRELLHDQRDLPRLRARVEILARVC